MSISELIEENRITLGKVPFDRLKVENYDLAEEVMGRIAERFVFLWLCRCQGIIIDNFFPRTANGYKLEKKNSGILVIKDGIHKHEFDNLFFHNKNGDLRPYFVEVKSLHMNGAESKLERAFRLGKEVYERDVGGLLFIPFNENNKRYLRSLEEQHPRLHIIDSGYKKKTLKTAIRRFYKKKKIKKLRK